MFSRLLRPEDEGRQDHVVRWLQAPFRASVIVVIAGWLHALRGGFAASDEAIFGIYTLAVASGALVGGLVDARPRLGGIAVSAVASSGAAIFMLSYAVTAREQAAGLAASERLADALPWFGAGLVLLAVFCAAGGAALRDRLRRRSRHERPSVAD